MLDNNFSPVRESVSAYESGDDKGIFHVHVAQYVRAYGYVTVQAESPEKAIEAVTMQSIAEDFTPHGSKDDLDYKNNTQAVVTDVINAETEDVTEVYQDVSEDVKKFMVWVCEVDDMGRIYGTNHVSIHHTNDPEQAAECALKETADTWERFSTEGLHVLGIVSDQFKIIKWDEGNTD